MFSGENWEQFAYVKPRGTN